MEKQKKTYSIPRIERIVLDNEISLQLESATPPYGPGESRNVPEQHTDEPFKQHLV